MSKWISAVRDLCLDLHLNLRCDPHLDHCLNRWLNHRFLDNGNNPNKADTQPFNSSSDEDYAEVARRLEDATTGEDYEQV